MGEENTRRMENDRKTFMLNVKSERFLVCYNRMVETELALKVTTREVQSRTWYSLESWDYGGLRLKKEDVEEGSGASQAKRRKTS